MGQKQACIEHLQGLSAHLKSIFQVYYEYTVELKVPRRVFTAYI